MDLQKQLIELVASTLVDKVISQTNKTNNISNLESIYQ